MLSCKSQTIYAIGTSPEQISDSSRYMKDINNYHDAIVGTWTWNFGNASFVMNLEETEYVQTLSGSPIFRDEVRATYSYTFNGNVVSEITTIHTPPDISIKFYYKSAKHYSLIIVDNYSGKAMNGNFILNSASTAVMTLTDLRGIRLGGDNGLDFAIPKSMMLTKQ